MRACERARHADTHTSCLSGLTLCGPVRGGGGSKSVGLARGVLRQVRGGRRGECAAPCRAGQGLLALSLWFRPRSSLGTCPKQPEKEGERRASDAPRGRTPPAPPWQPVLRCSLRKQGAPCSQPAKDQPGTKALLLPTGRSRGKDRLRTSAVSLTPSITVHRERSAGEEAPPSPLRRPSWLLPFRPSACSPALPPRLGDRERGRERGDASE